MTERDAIDLNAPAINGAPESPSIAGPPAPHWADLGAGTGTFTRALAAIIGTRGTVEAVERDDAARAQLTRLSGRQAALRAQIVVSSADFTRPLPFRDLSGVLLANALHFVPYAQQQAVMRLLATCLAPAGRIVLVEYDRASGNQWVPYPVSFENFVALCRSAGFADPVDAGRIPSAFGGQMFCGWTSAA
ncbi:MAG: class I SAM-dependent methyltransferase [Gemmatimonas sp.]